MIYECSPNFNQLSALVPEPYKELHPRHFDLHDRLYHAWVICTVITAFVPDHAPKSSGCYFKQNSDHVLSLQNPERVDGIKNLTRSDMSDHLTGEFHKPAETNRYSQYNSTQLGHGMDSDSDSDSDSQ